MTAPSFTCARCGRTSHHPLDVQHRYCGHCHIYIDQWLCIRVRVAGDVVSEHWFDALDPGDVEGFGDQDGAVCSRAQAAGLHWQLEIFDPSSERTVRVASRREGMTAPEAINLDDGEMLLRRIAQALGYS